MIPLQPPKELSGFSILRDDLAAICINDREPIEGAKIFTLFHEYCHLLLRQTGISDENNSNEIERFCNSFAASFLIPRNPLIEAIGGVQTPCEFSDADVKRLSARFRVSNSAMALRLEKTGLAPTGFYAKRTAPWDIQIEPRPVKSKRGPSPITIRIKRIGRLHAATVLRERCKNTSPQLRMAVLSAQQNYRRSGPHVRRRGGPCARPKVLSTRGASANRAPGQTLPVEFQRKLNFPLVVLQIPRGRNSPKSAG